MKTALVSIALLGVLLFLLSFVVSYYRINTKRGFGGPDDPTAPLNKAIRAHGNTAEYIGIVAVIMLALGLTSPAAWVEWTMIAFVIGRIITAFSFLITSSLDNIFPLKVAGMTLTYSAGVVLSVALLVKALSYSNILVS
jgi:uncharacterized protein